MKTPLVPFQIRAFDLLKGWLKEKRKENTPEGRHLYKIAMGPAARAQRRLDKGPASPKEKEWQKERDKADDAASLYIRTRDTFLVAPGIRRGYCATCKKLKEWSELQCGHWLRRRFFGVRYHEYNMHAQCETCNKPATKNYGGGNGMEPEHEAHIAAIHGSHWPDRLRAFAKMYAKKPDVAKLKKYTEEYTQKLNGLLK